MRGVRLFGLAVFAAFGRFGPGLQGALLACAHGVPRFLQALAAQAVRGAQVCNGSAVVKPGCTAHACAPLAVQLAPHVPVFDVAGPKVFDLCWLFARLLVEQAKGCKSAGPAGCGLGFVGFGVGLGCIVLGIGVGQPFQFFALAWISSR